MIITILATIVALGVLVTVHEFGHYWVAKRCGVRVLRFSVGFGRALYTWKDQSGTGMVTVLTILESKGRNPIWTSF